MKNLRKNKGITLIALVITIIVLLILAGVSIATLTGQNGLLTKANNAKERTLLAEETEIIKMAYTSVLTNNKTEGLEISSSNLQKEIKTIKDATVEEVSAIPEGGNIIENGITDGVLCKIIMEDTYYMYLENGQDNSLKKFYIELYSDYTYSELLETLTFNYNDSITDIYSWFESKGSTEFEEWFFSETFPGGTQVYDFDFSHSGKSYTLSILVTDENGIHVGEDDLIEGKAFKAYFTGE